MKSGVNIKKRYVYFAVGLLIILTGVFLVNAYTNPSTGVGHDADEIGPGTFGNGGNYIFPPGSNVGIGTESPDTKLTISGSTIVNSLYSSIYLISALPGIQFKDTDNNYLTAIQGGDDILFWTNRGSWGIVKMIIEGDTGNVGIGTASPREKLDVQGTIQATGDICIEGGNCLSSIGPANWICTHEQASFGAGPGTITCPTGSYVIYAWCACLHGNYDCYQTPSKTSVYFSNCPSVYGGSKAGVWCCK